MGGAVAKAQHAQAVEKLPSSKAKTLLLTRIATYPERHASMQELTGGKRKRKQSVSFPPTLQSVERRDAMDRDEMRNMLDEVKLVHTVLEEDALQLLLWSLQKYAVAGMPTALHLVSCELGPLETALLAPVIQANKAAFRVLDLRGNDLTAGGREFDGIEALLGAVRRHPTLEELDLCGSLHPPVVQLGALERALAAAIDADSVLKRLDLRRHAGSNDAAGEQEKFVDIMDKRARPIEFRSTQQASAAVSASTLSSASADAAEHPIGGPHCPRDALEALRASLRCNGSIEELNGIGPLREHRRQSVTRQRRLVQREGLRGYEREWVARRMHFGGIDLELDLRTPSSGVGGYFDAHDARAFVTLLDVVEQQAAEQRMEPSISLNGLQVGDICGWPGRQNSSAELHLACHRVARPRRARVRAAQQAYSGDAEEEHTITSQQRTYDEWSKQSLHEGGALLLSHLLLARAAARGCERLTSVDLSGNALGCRGAAAVLRALAQPSGPAGSLTALDISQCMEDGERMLAAPLAAFLSSHLASSLEVLECRGNGLGASRYRGEVLRADVEAKRDPDAVLLPESVERIQSGGSRSAFRPRWVDGGEDSDVDGDSTHRRDGGSSSDGGSGGRSNDVDIEEDEWDDDEASALYATGDAAVCDAITNGGAPRLRKLNGLELVADQEYLTIDTRLLASRLEPYETTFLARRLRSCCGPGTDGTMQIHSVNLKDCQLSHNVPGEDCTVALIDTLACLPRLTALELAGNNLKINAARALARLLRRNRSVTSLGLCNNRSLRPEAREVLGYALLPAAAAPKGLERRVAGAQMEAATGFRRSALRLLACDTYTFSQGMTRVDLCHRGLVDADAVLLAGCLAADCISVTAMDLTENPLIGAQGGQALLRALDVQDGLFDPDDKPETDTTPPAMTVKTVSLGLARIFVQELRMDRLTELVLARNQLGVAAMIVIASSLRLDGNMRTLDLSHNEIGPVYPHYDACGIEALADAMFKCTSLTLLDLTDTKVCGLDRTGAGRLNSKGVRKLCEAMRANESIATLRLGDNHLVPDVAQALADSLMFNKTMLTLDLGHNAIGLKGGLAMARALRSNRGLTRLNLSGNVMPVQAAVALADALAVNKNMGFVSLDQAELPLHDLRGTTEKQALDFSSQGLQVCDLAIIMKIIGSNRQLRSIDLSFNNLGSHTKLDRTGIPWMIHCLDKNGKLSHMSIVGNWNDAISVPAFGAEYGERVHWA